MYNLGSFPFSQHHSSFLGPDGETDLTTCQSCHNFEIFIFDRRQPAPLRAVCSRAKGSPLLAPPLNIVQPSLRSVKPAIYYDQMFLKDSTGITIKSKKRILEENKATHPPSESVDCSWLTLLDSSSMLRMLFSSSNWKSRDERFFKFNCIVLKYAPLRMKICILHV